MCVYIRARIGYGGIERSETALDCTVYNYRYHTTKASFPHSGFTPLHSNSLRGLCLLLLSLLSQHIYGKPRTRTQTPKKKQSVLKCWRMHTHVHDLCVTGLFRLLTHSLARSSFIHATTVFHQPTPRNIQPSPSLHLHHNPRPQNQRRITHPNSTQPPHPHKKPHLQQQQPARGHLPLTYPPAEKKPTNHPARCAQELQKRPARVGNSSDTRSRSRKNAADAVAPGNPDRPTDRDEGSVF